MAEFIPIDKADIRLLGRTVFGGGAQILGYSLSGVEFDFYGTTLSAELSTEWVNDEPWKENFKPYAAVFADGELISRFSVDEGGSKSYDIFSCEKPKHTVIRILKLSENAFSRIMLKGFFADGQIKATSPQYERRIEFVGDSITCGFGIEARSVSDGFSTATENPLINYASLTAKEFNAEYNLVSWTAIGVYSNSVSDGRTEPDNAWTMPVIYDYADKAADGLAGIDPPRKWDFSSFVPELIVVNLGTNDKDFTRGIPERTAAFEKTYKEFIAHIRELNPDSYIICALGAMGQELCPQVESAVAELNDKRISALRFPVQDEADGIGAEWHPSEKTHRKMADILIAEIKKTGVFQR